MHRLRLKGLWTFKLLCLYDGGSLASYCIGNGCCCFADTSDPLSSLHPPPHCGAVVSSKVKSETLPLDQQPQDKAIPGCLPSTIQRSTSLLDWNYALSLLYSLSCVCLQHSSWSQYKPSDQWSCSDWASYTDQLHWFDIQEDVPWHPRNLLHASSTWEFLL